MIAFINNWHGIACLPEILVETKKLFLSVHLIVAPQLISDLETASLVPIKSVQTISLKMGSPTSVTQFVVAFSLQSVVIIQVILALPTY